MYKDFCLSSFLKLDFWAWVESFDKILIDFITLTFDTGLKLCISTTQLFVQSLQGQESKEVTTKKWYIKSYINTYKILFSGNNCTKKAVCQTAFCFANPPSKLTSVALRTFFPSAVVILSKGGAFKNKNVLLLTDKKKHSPHIQAMALNSKPCTIVFPSLISDSE